MVFYDYPIPGHGLPAVISHEAAYCAGEQGHYWEMHDAIFAHQADVTKVDPKDEAAAQAVLVTIGEGIGLDGAALKACLVSKRYRPILATLADTATKRGVNITPTLLVRVGDTQEVVPGYLPFKDFQPYLDRAVARAQGTPVPTVAP